MLFLSLRLALSPAYLRGRVPNQIVVRSAWVRVGPFVRAMMDARAAVLILTQCVQRVIVLGQVYGVVFAKCRLNNRATYLSITERNFLVQCRRGPLRGREPLQESWQGKDHNRDSSKNLP